jgi:cell division protein FtsL
VSAVTFERRISGSRAITSDAGRKVFEAKAGARRRASAARVNARIAVERDNRVFFGQILLLVCGVMLAGGFVYAAEQKFAAVNLGYRAETLRQEREGLLAERRRLLLERDRIISPSQLEQAAKEAGLIAASAAQVQVLKTHAPQKSPTNNLKFDEKSKRDKTARVKPTRAKL